MHKALFEANGELSRLSQVEHYAHVMASILGQWIDEGNLADISKLKKSAQSTLDRFEEIQAEE
jgi:hypothetical protein